MERKRRMKPHVIVLLGCLGFLSACNGGTATAERAIDQSSVCMFDSREAAKACRDGQLAMFNPSSWGDEQLPLIVAATSCDWNHPVIHNKAGVVCVFTSQRLKQ